MADSAPKVADIERQESLQAVDLKAQKLADLITKAKHFIAFTGAGVSTSAGKRAPCYSADTECSMMQRYSRFPGPRRSLDAPSTGKATNLESHKHAASNTDAYTHGTSCPAGSGNAQILDQPKL